jgi:hypothetical protein
MDRAGMRLTGRGPRFSIIHRASALRPKPPKRSGHQKWEQALYLHGPSSENAARTRVCACSSTTAMSRIHMICMWIWGKAASGLPSIGLSKLCSRSRVLYELPINPRNVARSARLFDTHQDQGGAFDHPKSTTIN